jgi:predicted ATPase
MTGRKQKKSFVEYAKSDRTSNPRRSRTWSQLESSQRWRFRINKRSKNPSHWTSTTKRQKKELDMSTAPSKEVVPTVDDRTKPPFLRRVQIRGYKSIAFCDVTLEPLTILVGRNGSGKSNFLDALAFLRDSLEGGLDFALEEHGGIAVFSQELKTNRLSFEIECEFPSYKMSCRATYRLDLVLSDRKQLEVDQEYLRLDDITNERFIGFTVVRGQVSWQGLKPSERIPLYFEPHSRSGRYNVDPSTGELFRTSRLLLDIIGAQPFLSFAEGIRSMGFFNFHPEAIREPQRSIGSPILIRDGRNLARAIEGLKEISKEDLSRVKAYIQAIVPEIEGFEVVPVADFETIRFRVYSRIKDKPLELYAGSMSDGTLRVLASLIAAFHIALPHGYPSLVAIEEPETSLHPTAMRALVDALDEATLRTQILLTTHSAEMLDNPTIRPENIRVVQMIDGETVIGPVDEASVEIVRQKLDTLGRLERQNQLEPDLDDQDRQRQLSQNGKGQKE